EVDDEQLELVAGDFLLLDGHDLANTVSRVDDELVGPKPLTLSRAHRRRSRQLGRPRGYALGRLLVLVVHAVRGSLVAWFGPTDRFGLGARPCDGIPRPLRSPPDGAGGPLLHRAALLQAYTRLCCHSSRVEVHAP